MIVYLINLVNIFVQLITILVIIKIILSYFMSPYHPVRLTIDRVVDPMLRPIQRVIPTMGMLDFSPIILIIIVQLLGRIVISILLSIFH
jgi:YggT family protein